MDVTMPFEDLLVMPFHLRSWQNIMYMYPTDISLYRRCCHMLRNRVVYGVTLQYPRMVTEALHEAVENGHTSCFMAAYTEARDILITNPDEFEEKTCEHAARIGKYHMLLHFCLNLWFRWDARATTAAAGGGHIASLAYMHTQGCPWTAQSCSMAAQNGHLECLRYAIDHGCEWREEAATIMESAAKFKGDTLCLQYMYDLGCELTVDVCRAAALAGSIVCLRYLHEYGCPWGTEVTAAAAEGGHVACLTYAYNNGCPMANNVDTIAAAGGHLDVLKYLKKIKFKWGEDACWTASAGGHILCLRYLHKKCNAPWDERTVLEAARNAKITCLRYAVGQGLPCTQEALYAAAYSNLPGDLSCSMYLRYRLRRMRNRPRSRR